MELLSKVYVKTDEQNCIVGLDGGYTTPADLAGWTQIDEGYGDKYNLCQSNYLPKPLYAEGGFPQYKLVDGKVVERSAEELEADRLPVVKAQRIAQSKADLATYLESHPIQWTDGQRYSITAEKQQQLTGKILSATLAQQTATPYSLTWNSTGQVCKEWTLEELGKLAFAIDARVTALVTYQQTQEVAMREAESLEALAAIEVDYDTVG